MNDVLVASNEGRERENGGMRWVLGGEEPTEADATVYGMLAAVLVASA